MSIVSDGKMANVSERSHGSFVLLCFFWLFSWFGNMKMCAKTAALVFVSFLLAWKAYIRGIRGK